MKFSLVLTTLVLTFSVGLAMNSSFGATTTKRDRLLEAAPNPRETLLSQRRRLGFRVPNLSPSGNLRGGAARGKCNSEGQPVSITPLMPLTKSIQSADDKQNVGVYPALTTAAQPQFFVHIPQTTAREAKFILLEEINSESENVLYEGIFPLTGNAGVVSFSLPADKSLEIGKTYKWSVEVICDASDNSGNPSVEGLVIQRVPTPPALSNVEQIAPMERPALYAERELWYDAVSALAQLRSANPNDPTLADDWKDLLTSVNLEAIATEPLVKCCTPNQE